MTETPTIPPHLAHWTLKRVRDAGLEIGAICPDKRCGRTYAADLDAMIEHYGAETPLNVLDGQKCEACSASLRIGLTPRTDDDPGFDLDEDEEPERDRGWTA